MQFEFEFYVLCLYANLKPERLPPQTYMESYVTSSQDVSRCQSPFALFRNQVILCTQRLLSDHFPRGVLSSQPSDEVPKSFPPIIARHAITI